MEKCFLCPYLLINTNYNESRLRENIGTKPYKLLHLNEQYDTSNMSFHSCILMQRILDHANLA